MAKIKLTETQLQAVKFTLLSGTAAVVEAGSYALFLALDLMPVSWAQAISVALSVLWNFTLNRKFTFKSTGNVPFAMLLVSLFYVAYIPISSVLAGLMDDAGMHPAVIKIIWLLINFVGEFIWWKYVVFGIGERWLDSITKRKAAKNEAEK
ncbi:MAG: GtrA family protein [Trueperella sp.]|nr:GtrA family protein [Trueperella sp.]